MDDDIRRFWDADVRASHSMAVAAGNTREEEGWEDAGETKKINELR